MRCGAGCGGVGVTWVGVVGWVAAWRMAWPRPVRAATAVRTHLEVKWRVVRVLVVPGRPLAAELKLCYGVEGAPGPRGAHSRGAHPDMAPAGGEVKSNLLPGSLDTDGFIRDHDS